MTPGTFIWRELYTPDSIKAKGFYGELVGWSVRDTEMAKQRYPALFIGEQGIGGLLPHDARIPRPWVPYVGVADVASTTKSAFALGGRAVIAPTTIDATHAYAILHDFAGAVFGLYQGSSGADPTLSLGMFCWESLFTSDLVRARDFYRQLFGWQLEAGPGGEGESVFATGSGTQVADLQLSVDTPPTWLSYVWVDSLKRALERAPKLGGKVIMPEARIPKVGLIGGVADPFGAPLGIFEQQM